MKYDYLPLPRMVLSKKFSPLYTRKKLTENIIHFLIIKVDVKRDYVVLNMLCDSVMIHFKSVG